MFKLVLLKLPARFSRFLIPLGLLIMHQIHKAFRPDLYAFSFAMNNSCGRQFSRNLLLALKCLTISNCLFPFFLTLRKDSVVHQNPSENHINISKELQL